MIIRYLLVIILIAFPASANAQGFLLGYALGSSNRGSEEESALYAIPPACFFVKSLIEYNSCRLTTALTVYHYTIIKNNPEYDRDYEYKNTMTLMKIEYENIILPLQTESNNQPKPEERQR